MKLLRYGSHGKSRLCLLAGDGIVDIDDLRGAFTDMRGIVAGGSAALDAVRERQDRACALALADAHLLAPIERPGKYLAIGMNYAKHLEEADKLGVARSKHQVWFNKQTSCLSGPYDDIDPGVTEKLDYEVELGVVIGAAAKHVSEADAPAHVFGYFVANDVSARDWQFHSPTFTLGKSFDTHGPIGPWIVPPTRSPIRTPHHWPRAECR